LKNKRNDLVYPEEFWKNVNPDAKDLVQRMTCRDQYKRISAKECLEHKWLQAGINSKIALKIVVAPTELASGLIQLPVQPKKPSLLLPESGSYSPKILSKNARDHIPDISPLMLTRGNSLMTRKILTKITEM
jgi:serine/threonine protein kinase